ncbi:MEDS domain-containing protein, partial [Chloroflexota bacterium]
MLSQYADLDQELEQLKTYGHLCLLYEMLEEWRDVVISFLTIGLRRGEKCLYITDTYTADQVRGYLHQEGIDVPAVEASGQLINLQATDTYLREGSFNPGRMIALLIAQVEKAVAEGYLSLRVSCEMSWALHGDPDLTKLLEYEAKLNRNLFSSYPCTGLCVYDLRKFNPEIIKGVIMTHPLLVRGNRLYRNHYYLSPAEFLSQKRPKYEVDLLLKAIAESEASEIRRRQSDQLSQALFDYSMVGLYIIQDGKLQLFSPEFQRTTGYSRNELLGVEPLKFILSEDRDTARESALKMLAGERSSPYEFRVVTKSGELKWVMETVTPIRYQGRRAVLGNTVDITEYKQIEEKY